MCGIAGIISAAPEEATVREMVQRIRHRGPDDSGIETLPGCVLGHTRLSVIDLSTAGHQPMCNEDRSIWCVFNGEIYNFRTLRSDLKERGHLFRGDSDTECLVHGYEEYGPAFLKKIDGMFALALYDTRSRELVLARDCFGKKPLFYTASSDRVTFASELKALLPALKSGPTLNLEAYESFMALQYSFTDECILEGVQKLSPATYILFENGTQREKRRFWSLNDHPLPDMGGRKPHEAVRELVFRAVRKRRVSHVPLGVLLSGGLDSSIVTVAMSRTQKPPIMTFTAGFGEADDEFIYAHELARRERTEHTDILIQAEDVKQLLPKIVYHADEPLADGGGVATFLLAEKLKPHVSVLLVGEGADELFGGYRWHRLGLRRYDLVPAALRRRAYLYLNSFAPLRLQNRIWPKVRKIMSENRLSAPSRRPELLSDLFGFEQSELLPNSLLMKVDRMLMAFAVEPRVPFLDRDLVRYVTALPKSERIGKNLLRQAFSDLLPAKILGRAKQGFRLPFHKWIHGALREEIRAALLDPSTLSRQYWGEKFLRNLFSRPRSLFGRISQDCLLWRLYIFELWQDAFGVKS